MKAPDRNKNNGENRICYQRNSFKAFVRPEQGGIFKRNMKLCKKEESVCIPCLTRIILHPCGLSRIPRQFCLEREECRIRKNPALPLSEPETVLCMEKPWRMSSQGHWRRKECRSSAAWQGELTESGRRLRCRQAVIPAVCWAAVWMSVILKKIRDCMTAC